MDGVRVESQTEARVRFSARDSVEVAEGIGDNAEPTCRYFDPFSDPPQKNPVQAIRTIFHDSVSFSHGGGGARRRGVLMPLLAQFGADARPAPRVSTRWSSNRCHI